MVDHDTEINLQMSNCYGIMLSIEDGQHRRPNQFLTQFKLKIRRRDLDKNGPEQTTRAGVLDLAPGNWEVWIDTGSGLYPAKVAVGGRAAISRSQNSAEGWNLIQFRGGQRNSRRLGAAQQSSS